MRFAKAVPIKTLKPWDRNPRKHTKDVESIVKSIEHFGWTNPILVQEKTHRVIAGHGRLQAAQQAGLKTVPAIYLKLNDQDATAYTVADNKLAELSEWDEVALGAILGELDRQSFDNSLLGFSDDEINQLLTRESETLERTALDDAPEPPKKATSKKGERWQLGEHRLVCGDSTDPKVVGMATEGASADLVFTDPPYGVDYVGKTKDALTIENDDLGDGGTRELVADAARAWPLRPGGSFYLCGPAGDTETAFRLALRDADYTLRQCLVWVKQHFVMGRQDYHWRHETILYGWKDGAGHYFIDDRTQDTVLEEDRPMASVLHPTMKPVALIERLMRNSSVPKDLVFDGFGGSGSTMIAAEQQGRRSVLIELDPRYVDVIIERWQQVTGGKAKRL